MTDQQPPLPPAPGEAWPPPPEDTSENWSPPASAALPDRSSRKIIAITGAVVVVIAAIAIGLVLTRNSSSSKLDVKGSLMLSSLSTFGDAGLETGSPCSGSGGYSDITDGTQVAIYDDSGKTLGLGSLSAGHYAGLGSCDFDFEVSEVPSGKKFYKVEVAHRGTVQFTEQQLKQGPDLTLGDGS